MQINVFISLKSNFMFLYTINVLKQNKLTKLWKCILFIIDYKKKTWNFLKINNLLCIYTIYIKYVKNVSLKKKNQ